MPFITTFASASARGFKAPGVSTVQTLLDNATGTNIGNSTVGFSAGGLAAAFDGTTSQAIASCCRSNGGNPAWFGKYFSGAAKKWSGFKLYGPNNSALSGNLSGHTCTWKFYVKATGQSTSRTDGMLVASGTFVVSTSAGGNSAGLSFLTGITPTLGESCFVDLEFVGNSGDDVNLAEVQLFYEV